MKLAALQFILTIIGSIVITLVYKYIFNIQTLSFYILKVTLIGSIATIFIPIRDVFVYYMYSHEDNSIVLISILINIILILCIWLLVKLLNIDSGYIVVFCYLSANVLYTFLLGKYVLSKMFRSNNKLKNNYNL